MLIERLMASFGAHSSEKNNDQFLTHFGTFFGCLSVESGHCKRIVVLSVLISTRFGLISGVFWAHNLADFRCNLGSAAVLRVESWVCGPFERGKDHVFEELVPSPGNMQHNLDPNSA